MAEPTVGIKAVFDGAGAISGLKKLRQGVDEATKSARSQSSVVGGLARVQKSVGALVNVYTAAAAGAFAVGAATFSLLKEYAAAEVSQNRLTASVKAATGSWTAYRASLDATIQAGMDKAFDDEQQMDALSRLVQGTQDVEQAQRLMAIAQDVSRGTGKDLTSTSIMLGKVYNGNTAALKRFGIAVKDGMTAEEALAEIQKRFAGQADAYANSTQGRIDKLTTAWANVREAAGAALVDAGASTILDRYTTSLRAFSEQGAVAGAKMYGLQVAAQWGIITNKEADDSYKKMYGSLGSLSRSAGDAATSFQDLAAAQQETVDASYAMEDASIADERSHLRLKEAKKALNEAIKEHGKKSDEAKRATLDYRDAVLGAKRADDALRDAMADSDDPTQRAIANMQRLRKEADRLKSSAGQAASALDKMFGKGAGDATRKAATYGGRADRALGAIEPAVPGGRWVRVAEAGDDEAIIPLNRSARSLSLLNEAAKRIGVGGGGNTTNISISGARTDADFIASQVRLALAGSVALPSL